MTGSILTDVPAVPERTGYEVAWDFDFNNPITQDLTVTAVYTFKSYTITYAPGINGSGKNIAADTKTHGVALNLPSETFTRTGYTQTGWAASDGGTKAYDLGGEYTADAAVTLYPFWTINTYAVTYNAGANGAGSVFPQDKTYGESLVLSTSTYTRTGYMQTGWAESDGGAKAYDLGGEYTADEAVTLYPFWAVDTYAVTYSAGENGEGSIAAGTKTYDAALTLSSETFTRTGYTQAGWSESDGGAKAYDLGGEYTANAAVTLYPFWTADAFTVTFVADGVTVAVLNIPSGSGVATEDIPAVPAKTGYTGAWENVDLSEITSNVTVNAVYTEKASTGGGGGCGAVTTDGGNGGLWLGVISLMLVAAVVAKKRKVAQEQGK